MKEKCAFQIKIELKYTRPAVIRTIALPLDATMQQLHECIQLLFGWFDIHPYAFLKEDSPKKFVRYVEDWDEVDDEDSVFLAGEEHYIGDCLEVGDKWIYVYDFGDEWQHEITVEDDYIVDKPGKPQLISWEGENLCEDVGGTTGYYEKLEILEDPKHENYEEVKDFMERNRQEFQVNRIQFDLMNLEKDFFADKPHIRIADYCNDIFMLTARDTLFHVETDKGSCLYIWFSDHDDDKCVYFFRKEIDFIHGYFSNIEHESIYPLYFNGYRLNYPEIHDLEDMDLPGELLMPQLRKYEAGIGEVDITKAESDEIKEIVIWINDLLEDFCDDLIAFPDIDEQKKVYIAIDGNTADYRIAKMYVELKTQPKRLTKKETEQLHEKRHTGERLHMNLLSVADIVHIGNVSNYYIAATGNTTGFLHLLKQHETAKAMTEIKDRFIAYMISCGIPQALYVSDLHLYRLFSDICEVLQIDLMYRQYDQETIMEQYEEAIAEQNPLENFDQDLIEKLMSMSDEEMLRFIEEQPDEKMKRLLKQILFMNIFIKE